jgi:phage gp36-like protein
MAYCTVTDLKNTLPESQLIQLTDDNDTGQIDTEKLAEAIRKADDFIDGHIRGRYDLPLTTVPSMIRDISIRLSTWFLFRRSFSLTLPEPLTEDYKDCVEILMRVQKGQISPFPNPPSQEPTFFLSNSRPSVVGGITSGSDSTTASGSPQSGGAGTPWSGFLI